MAADYKEALSTSFTNNEQVRNQNGETETGYFLFHFYQKEPEIHQQSYREELIKIIRNLDIYYLIFMEANSV